MVLFIRTTPRSITSSCVNSLIPPVWIKGESLFFLPWGFSLRTPALQWRRFLQESWVSPGCGSPAALHPRSTDTHLPSRFFPASTARAQTQRRGHIVFHFWGERNWTIWDAPVVLHLYEQPLVGSFILIQGHPPQCQLHGGSLHQHWVGVELPQFTLDAWLLWFEYELYLLRFAWKDHTLEGAAKWKTAFSTG